MKTTTLEIGPLTAKVVGVAGWARDYPKCPPSQRWADEFERVFSYADSKGQFAIYFNRLTSDRYPQFDSYLAELRVTYYFDCIGFPVTKWEPIPKSGNAGEYIVLCPSGEEVFVEVKSPGWESELKKEELKAGRAKQEKNRDNEGRSIATYKAIQCAIQKAYKKFDADSHNLLVIVDDLFVSLAESPDMFARKALYESGGFFSSNAFENLGGVGIFWIDQNSEQLFYRMELFINDYALPTSAIPESMAGRWPRSR
jgi:hypothetical protein